MGRQYIPILKGKQGELRALCEMYPEHLDGARPLLEVIGAAAATDDDARADAIDSSVKRIKGAWNPERPPIIVDAIDLEPEADSSSDDAEQATPVPAVRKLIDALRDVHIKALPVVRLTDPPETFEALRDSCGRDGYGALIRVTPSDLDDSVLPLYQLIESRATDLGLTSPEDVDVLLDFGAVPDENAVALASRLGKFLIGDLTRQRWRSVAVSAGAFPPDLSGVQANTIGSIPRLDKQLWQSLNKIQLDRPLDFADYAVSHPLLPVGGAFAAPPQLRYTVNDAWLVMKGRRQDRRGHAQFYDICHAIERLEEARFDPRLSWGDGYIHQAAMSVASPITTTGNASTWRSIATSHHLGWVVRSLCERDEP